MVGDRGFNSDDYVEQINYLRDLAGSLADLHSDGECSATEIVSWWCDDPGADSELPEWFSARDRKFLTECVAGQLIQPVMLTDPGDDGFAEETASFFHLERYA